MLLIQIHGVDNRCSTKGLEARAAIPIGLSYDNEETVRGLLAWLEMI